MSRIEWDKIGERFYEMGVDRGVVYPLLRGNYQNGVAWNGLTTVNETAEGAEISPLYADDIKYVNLMSAEECKATVEAYQYPDSFKECLGEATLANGVTVGQQRRKHFGFSYRTKIGNDEEGEDCGYKVHILFDCIALPSDRSYSAINDSPEAMTYSWEFSTTPVEIEGYRPTASMTLDSRKFRKEGLYNVLRIIEDYLYGTDDSDPTFLRLSQLAELYSLGMYLRDNDNEELLDSSGCSLQSQVFN